MYHEGRYDGHLRSFFNYSTCTYYCLQAERKRFIGLLHLDDVLFIYLFIYFLQIITAGSLGLSAAKGQNRGMLIANGVLSILAAIAAAIGMGFSFWIVSIVGASRQLVRGSRWSKARVFFTLESFCLHQITYVSIISPQSAITHYRQYYLFIYLFSQLVKYLVSQLCIIYLFIYLFFFYLFIYKQQNTYLLQGPVRTVQY